MGVWDSIIGAGSSLLGGFLGNDSAEKAAQLNYQAQKEFAQQGVRWKVADAEAAGIHPLYALGASTASFSPSFVGDTSLANGVAAAGQNIGRAVDAMRTPDEKASAYSQTAQQLQLQRMGLENELLASQIAVVKQAGQPPGMPSTNQRYLIDGQKGTILVNTVPHERTASDPANMHMEAGAVNDIGFTRTATGWMPVMSKDAKERLEEDFLGGMAWNMRNRLLPNLGANYSPPPMKAPAGKRWLYNPAYQEYQLVDEDSWYKYFR